MICYTAIEKEYATDSFPTLRPPSTDIYVDDDVKRTMFWFMTPLSGTLSLRTNTWKLDPPCDFGQVT